jgi:predicted transcriptional regulator
MTLDALLDTTLAPLTTNDRVSRALGRMADEGVVHLPVIDTERRLVTTVGEDQLFDAEALDPEADLGRLASAEPVAVTPETHPFEAARLMVSHDLTTVPVVGEGYEYLGIVRRQQLFNQLAQMLEVGESGAIVEVELGERDYALAQLVYAVEQNGAKVLSLSTEPLPEQSVLVTLKLNVGDTARIRAILEHYGYTVSGAFGESESEEDIQSRVSEFMRYLEV